MCPSPFSQSWWKEADDIWCNLTKITKETLSWSDELYPKSFLQEEPMMTGSGAIVYMTDVYNLLRGILP